MSNSPTPPENAELREAFIKAGFQIVDNQKVAKQTFLVITENEFVKIASFLGFQASRIRAEVLDLMEREVIGEDYEVSARLMPSARLASEWRNHEHSKQRDRLASLRQKPGERGEG